MRPDGGAKQLTSKGAAGHVHRDCRCGARRIDSQIGLEQTPAAYVAQIVAAMREVWRVLRDDGTLWLNLGDSYAAQRGGTSMPAQTVAGGISGKGDAAAFRGMSNGYSTHRNAAAIGYKHKDLMGIPWRVAFALQDDGWYLRSDIIWAKPNPMPESVTDRPTKSHEYLFLLAKQPRYYYDAEAIREDVKASNTGDLRVRARTADGPLGGENQHNIERRDYAEIKGANARSVWQIATQPYSGAHFATMPPELARRCILAGTSARGQCPKCGAPWTRVIERTDKEDTSARGSTFDGGKTGARDNGDRTQKGPRFTKEATGWAASCECNAGDPIPQIVLDPFAGSGTTAMVALQNGRRAIGTELNPKYLRLQDDRTQVTIGLGL